LSALYGGIEAGGTKFICAVGTGPHDLQSMESIPTTTPVETIKQVTKFFQLHEGLASIGIGSFGPVDLNPSSPSYGYITTTPKPGWAYTDLAGGIGRVLNVPIGFDTDVNAAALGEYHWGAAQGLNNFIYLTIGTGIGGGAIINGKPVHGLVHTEMGHIRIPHDTSADKYRGSCPFHGDCFEGLACGIAVEQRWGQRGETLPSDHRAWVLEAHYLALAITDFICTLSPQRVIIGGGIMEQTQLFSMIRENVQQMLNGYIQANEILKEIDNYIVPPGLGKHSGVVGAIALAIETYRLSTRQG
jgi:fructokinase